MFLRRTITSLTVLFAGIAFTGSSASAQTAQAVCGDHQMITERLAAEYNEMPHGAGLVSENKRIEIFTDTEEGSWTILLTYAGGPSCIIATGESWQSLPGRMVQLDEPF